MKKSGCKSSGQPGDPGNTLKQTPNPDHVVEHVPQFCNQCGRSFSAEVSKDFGARQVTDFPDETRSLVTEHYIYEKQCSCSCMNKETFPSLERETGKIFRKKPSLYKNQ